jgi:hypothetical protein
LQLGKLITKLNACPENIYTMDDRGFMLGQGLQVKFIHCRGRRNPHYSHDGNREMVIVIECIPSASTVIPPMYIDNGGKYILESHAGVQAKEQTTFACSSKDWTNNEFGLE